MVFEVNKITSGTTGRTVKKSLFQGFYGFFIAGQYFSFCEIKESFTRVFQHKNVLLA